MRVEISRERLQSFFERFPLLDRTLATLSKADIPSAIGGSGCLFLLGNERLPDDVDIYLPNNLHDKADQLFDITSFPFRSTQEEVRNSNPENNHSIQLTSSLVLKIDGRRYDLELTSDVLSKRLEVEHNSHIFFLYPPEDVLLIKALLQRGEDVGKHDIADIQTFLKVYPGLRLDYLSNRIERLAAKERVGSIFGGA